jgi:predicted nicotinamide N-methyase
MRRLEAGSTVRGPAFRFFTGAACAKTDDQMQYKLKIEAETIGTPGAQTTLQIESLANLNETIDDLFKELEQQGNPSLLESLCPYFGVVWPSARGLAEYLMAKGTEALRGQRVLEVGCGLALPSLVAAKLGARGVATDFHPDIPRFLARNVALNRIESLEFVSWDWQKSESALGTFDWVIGSDILYERQHPGPVARMLAKHVSASGRIVLADPGRPYLQAFADEMKALGFACEVQARNVFDTPARKDVFILELIRQGS